MSNPKYTIPPSHFSDMEERFEMGEWATPQKKVKRAPLVFTLEVNISEKELSVLGLDRSDRRIVWIKAKKKAAEKNAVEVLPEFDPNQLSLF